MVLLNTDAHSHLNEWFGIEADAEEAHQLRLHPTSVPNLHTAVWDDTTSLDEVLHALREHADVVILASPSLLHSPVSVETVRHAHGALLAVTSGTSRLSATIEARDVLDLLDIGCWGAVVARA